MGYFRISKQSVFVFLLTWYQIEGDVKPPKGDHAKGCQAVKEDNKPSCKNASSGDLMLKSFTSDKIIQTSDVRAIQKVCKSCVICFYAKRVRCLFSVSGRSLQYQHFVTVKSRSVLLTLEVSRKCDKLHFFLKGWSGETLTAAIM